MLGCQDGQDRNLSASILHQANGTTRTAFRNQGTRLARAGGFFRVLFLFFFASSAAKNQQTWRILAARYWGPLGDINRWNQFAGLGLSSH